MKQRLISLIAVLATFVMALALVGCNQKNAADDAAATSVTTAAEATVISPYEKAADAYKSIIDKLPKTSAYAFADMSKDHDVLLVTESPITFEGETNASRATVYGYDKNGDVKKYGVIESSSTSMPIMVKKNYAYFGSHHTMSRATVDEKNSKLVVETAKEGDKNYDAFFKAYNGGTMVKFTAGSAKAVAKADTKKTTKKAEKEVSNRDMEYISSDGWRIIYDAKEVESSEIDDHTAQFVYIGKSAGTNMMEVKYIANKQPEEVLYDVTKGWSKNPEAIKRTEGIFPGTSDKWGYWRELPAKNGKGLGMTAIAGEYNGGVLLFTITSHMSGKDEIDIPVSDAIDNMLTGIQYMNGFKDQTMYKNIPGTYKATKDNKDYKSVVLNKDHTGVITDAKGKKTEVLWGSTELTNAKTGKACQYTMEGTNLYMQVGDNWVEFAK